MGRRTNGIIRERKDYAWLLSELQGKENPAPPPKTPAAELEPKKSFSPFRQRIMSDETVKYLYSKEGGMFHDKSCSEARNIPDSELCYSRKYLSNIPQCPLCAVKAYVRLGAKDFYNFPIYERLFLRMKFNPSSLRRMYVQEKMRTSASSNGLTIWGKEDSWRLEFWDGSNTTRLMHNNYHPLPDGTRVFMPGYHIQAERATPAYALTVIAEYTYEGHKAAMRRREQEQLRKCSAQETPALQKESLVKKSRAPGVWEKVRLVLEEIKIWLRRAFQK